MATAGISPPVARRQQRFFSRSGSLGSSRPALDIAAHGGTVTKKTNAPKAAPSKPRRDATGHLDPTYASDLLEKSGVVSVDPDAFLDHSRSDDSLAEQLGEDAISAATSGGADPGELLDGVVPEENGGPFVMTSASSELEGGTDESNPPDATREPFPKV